MDLTRVLEWNQLILPDNLRAAMQKTLLPICLTSPPTYKRLYCYPRADMKNMPIKAGRLFLDTR
ncbi:hypothetical protein M433DRAFT_159158 [Acidomyces richmondensis BFW]|nr:MAG: hypothetical protein FE78DRAFT_83885 [Acidomyces sp. 'richmondensis']KYG41340.1 hypothetical protein M433DRAFT_159158 [Acidomyces richmondensis BFW]